MYFWLHYNLAKGHDHQPYKTNKRSQMQLNAAAVLTVTFFVVFLRQSALNYVLSFHNNNTKKTAQGNYFCI